MICTSQAMVMVSSISWLVSITRYFFSEASKPFPVQCFGRYLQAGVVGPGRRWPSQAANSCFIFHVPSLLAGRGTIAALCSAGFGGSALSEQRTAKWLGGDSVMACQVEKLWKQQVKDRL